MPAKIDTELNLRFLYICFKHSNFSTVASYFQIKAPAARMRLMRLRQALEAESSKEGFKEKDRKRRLNPFKAKDKMYVHDGEDDDDEALDDVPLMQRLHTRMMRIKREEGFMIKNEDGTLIKDEHTATVKNEDDDFWGKKEEGVDEQEERAMINAGNCEVGGTYFKSEIDDSRPDVQQQITPVGKEGAVKPENASTAYAPSPVQQHVLAPYPSLSQGATMAKPEPTPSLVTQHNGPYLSPVKLERRDYGYGRDQHIPAHPANAVPFNFRAYGHTNTSSPHVQHSDTVKPEHTNNSGHPVPFHGYSSISRPDVFGPFAQNKPETAYGNPHVTPPSSVASPFRLDMFNTALTNSVTLGTEARLRRDSVVSVVDSPMVMDDAPEAASDMGYPSPIARQSYQRINFG
ncbi:unnamed protein product [Aureobasidium vineae]|uniref:Myb-like DNA-binding domain-containing protein n=1 Tax=Aureobasidium vineae TaxID=2773715 RepID=A0A9N8PH91_9PEZI|nr:unnamed protein product [Aureobasidium vineae]